MPQMIVLDTHVWFWWINLEHQRFSALMNTALKESESLGVSVVSCYEIALAAQRNRLQLPCPTPQWFTEALAPSGVQCLSLSPTITHRAVDLTAIHRDPFDRMIIATTLVHDAMLLSLDSVFHYYPELQDRLIK
jgi:PIN domain nuclease of toxin-antitoxin system